MSQDTTDDTGEMVILVNNRSSGYIMVACSILDGHGIKYIPIPGGGETLAPIGLMVRKEDYEKATELIAGSGGDEDSMPAKPPMNQKLLAFFAIAGFILYFVIKAVLK
jgi:hypothetical protein